LCVNKPRNLLVHPAKGSHEDLLLLVRRRLEEDSGLSSEVGWDGQFAPSAVHRLDREVSGTVLVGVDGRVLPALHELFSERLTRKIYRAWCHRGTNELADEGVWEYPLTRKAEGRSKPAGFHRFQVPSETRYRVLRREKTRLELEMDLGTGRKHQLRRHCALAGHPIIGDDRYGPDGEEGDLLLHAWQLGFDEPGTGRKVAVETPLPPGWDGLGNQE